MNSNSRLRQFALAAALVLLAAQSSAAGNAERVKKFAALPDWTGIWLNEAWQSDASGRPPGGEAEIRAKTRMLAHPPYNPEWEQRYQQGINDKAMFAERMRTLKGCSRPFPAVMEGPYDFQLATLPEETMIIFNNGEVRHVYTDGRKHPGSDDLWETPLGDSVGHWEGDTLVSETIARDSHQPVNLRAWASFLSDQARIVEHLRRVSADMLEDRMTIDDPVAFARPWELTIRYFRQTRSDRLLPVDCDENDRNPLGADGNFKIAPPK